MRPSKKEIELGVKLKNARELLVSLAMSEASDEKRATARQRVRDLQEELFKAEDERRELEGTAKGKIMTEISELSGRIDELMASGAPKKEIELLSERRETLQETVAEMSEPRPTTLRERVQAEKTKLGDMCRKAANAEYEYKRRAEILIAQMLRSMKVNGIRLEGCRPRVAHMGSEFVMYTELISVNEEGKVFITCTPQEGKGFSLDIPIIDRDMDTVEALLKEVISLYEKKQENFS